MNSFILNLKHFWSELPRKQKLAIAGVLAGSLIALISIAYWANQPEYALLFRNLAPDKANKIVEILKQERIPYELREEGTAIYVPKKHVYELRLRLASEGLVTDGIVGYELFDKTTLGGMTDFVQKLNLKRALEGELARTINSIDQVEYSRVHLVLPERSAFQQTQTQPTASVVLQLKRGTRLSPAQIQGITALVAGAVEGLEPANVNIVDTQGNMLSDPEAADENLMASASQLRIQQELEDHLTSKAQSMLDQVLGPHNAIVRVSATLDFTHLLTQQEIIDPESATVISEEQLSQGEESGNGTNSVVRNYEISREQKRIERQTGEIKYLTVSVVLNYKRIPGVDEAGNPDPDAEPQYVPYSDEELQEIERLVKNAVGFNEERGDQITIHQSHFVLSPDQQIALELRKQQKLQQYMQYARYALMLLAIGLAVWLIRSTTRKVTELPTVINGGILQPAGSSSGRLIDTKDGPAALPDGETPLGELGDSEEDLVLLEDMYVSKLSAEAQARIKAKHILYQKVKESIDEHPENAANLIRTWLVESMENAPTP